jgi:hypothetical protein
LSFLWHQACTTILLPGTIEFDEAFQLDLEAMF